MIHTVKGRKNERHHDDSLVPWYDDNSMNDAVTPAVLLLAARISVEQSVSR